MPTARRSLEIVPGSARIFFLHALVKSPGGPLLLQLARYRKDDFEELRTYSWIDSYLIDPESGVGDTPAGTCPGSPPFPSGTLSGSGKTPFPR